MIYLGTVLARYHQFEDAIAVYNRRADTDTPELLHLLADFRQALQSQDNSEITMHYQPQVNLPTGTIDSLEALLRWTHPTSPSSTSPPP